MSCVSNKLKVEKRNGTHSRVDESNERFTPRNTGIVHHGQDSTYDRRRCRCSIDKLECTVDSNDIIRSISRKVGIATGLQKTISAVSRRQNYSEAYPRGVVDIFRV